MQAAASHTVCIVSFEGIFLPACRAKPTGCNAEQETTAGDAPDPTHSIAAPPNTAQQSEKAASQAQELAKRAWAKLGIRLLNAQQGGAGFVRALAQAGMDGLAQKIVRHLVSSPICGSAAATATLTFISVSQYYVKWSAVCFIKQHGKISVCAISASCMLACFWVSPSKLVPDEDVDPEQVV